MFWSKRWGMRRPQCPTEFNVNYQDLQVIYNLLRVVSSFGGQTMKVVVWVNNGRLSLGILGWPPRRFLLTESSLTDSIERWKKLRFTLDGKVRLNGNSMQPLALLERIQRRPDDHCQGWTPWRCRVGECCSISDTGSIVVYDFAPEIIILLSNHQSYWHHENLWWRALHSHWKCWGWQSFTREGEKGPFSHSQRKTVCSGPRLVEGSARGWTVGKVVNDGD